MAVVMALAIGALLVAAYLLRGQSSRIIPILTELGAWAAIRTGQRWTARQLPERLESGARKLVAAASRSTGLA